MYYAAIHLELNPQPGNPVGQIISLHSRKDAAQASACEALKAYDVLQLPEDQRRPVLIANVAQRFAGQTYIYRHDMLKGDVVKISVIQHYPIKAVC